MTTVLFHDTHLFTWFNNATQGKCWVSQAKKPVKTTNKSIFNVALFIVILLFHSLKIHDGVLTSKRFWHYLMTSSNWSFFRATGPFPGINRSPVNSPHNGSLMQTLMFFCWGSASSVKQTVEFYDTSSYWPNRASDVFYVCLVMPGFRQALSTQLSTEAPSRNPPVLKNNINIVLAKTDDYATNTNQTSTVLDLILMLF